MKYFKLLLLLTVILASKNIAYSQPVADFTSDRTSGCKAIGVNFTDKSTGTGTGTSYNWVFGNGNTSSDKSPFASYSSPGIYTVTLTVSDGVHTPSSKSATITVYYGPTAAFTADHVKGCTPLTVKFQDGSSADARDNTTLSSWLWNINGPTSTEQSPTHIFNNQGKQDISLTVTDFHGCSKTLKETSFIDVAAPPNARYSPDQTTPCKIPVLINFTNYSTGLGVLTYTWDFDNTLITGTNVSHTYTTWGSHSVKLTAKSDYGCESTIADSVRVIQVKAIGTITDNSIPVNNNDYICAYDMINFTNQSVGSSKYIWYFGDGDTIQSNPNPTHTYITGGNYTAKLVVAARTTCVDTAKWAFSVEKVTAQFTSTPAQSCLANVNVQFTNSSVNAASYLWRFDDASTSTATNPTKTYSAPADADPYVIHQQVTLSTVLTATGTHGCTSTANGSSAIQRPTALFSIDTAQGCAPLIVHFTSKSRSNEAITSYKWNFGDGTDTTTTTANAKHTYTTVGTYLANLIIANSAGCKDTSYNITIKTGKLPTPAFTLSNNNVCSSEPVTITNTTPVSDNVNYWQYTINGKSINACPADANPVFKLNTDTGNLIIKLTAGNNGCTAETSLPIHNKGPKISFTDSIECSTGKVYFKGVTTGTSYTWDFGNGTGTGPIISNQYPTNIDANYVVSFTSVKGICSETVVDTIRIRQRGAVFTLPPEGCTGVAIPFDGSGSHHKTDFCRDKYIWNFNDTTPLVKTGTDVIPHVFKNRGNYKVALTALYDNGCTDTVSHRIRIYRPYARLKADTTMGCPPLRVGYTDVSLPDSAVPAHAIKNLKLHFGDGQDTVSSAIGTQFSIHYYDYPGIFKAVLTVTDASNCQDSVNLPIKISQPNAVFTINPDNSNNSIPYGCANSDIAFQPSYDDADSVIWDFGDGTITHLKNPTINPIKHKYGSGNPFQTKMYHVTQKVYQYYCYGIFTDSVSILTADAKFFLANLADSIVDCPGTGGKVITFTHSYPSNLISSGIWSMGTPKKSYPYIYSYPSVSYTYTRGGNDTARLSITTLTPYSCTASYSKVIKIKGPQGKITVTPYTACKGTPIGFNIHDTLNVKNFAIDYGDGTLPVYGTSLNRSHIYSNVGKKYVSLLLFKDSTCTPPGIPDSVYIKEVIALFSVPDTSVCEQIPVKFTNSSLGNNQWKWNFDDGTTSNLQSPQHAFGLGTFKVKLTVTDPEVGCNDSLTRILTVHPNPTISVSLDKSKCPQNIAILHATGGDSIAWIPPTGLSNPHSYDPEAKPYSSTRYVAKVIYKSTKCFKTDSLLVTRANVNLAPTDTTVVIGDPVQIRLNSFSDVSSFTWNPTTDLNPADRLDPIITPSTDVIYYLILTEPGKCFTDTVKVNIKVDWTNLIFDLPSAFQPSGKDVNRILLVRGRGIKEVLEFKIYNRWGHLIFSSTDRAKGWDGTYQGKAQPVDTYIWVVTVRNFNDEIIKKQGTVLLMR
jgi:gliding motility-associated-like protein